MKNKAWHTLDAAQMLLNNRYGTESIHCSYYAVLQYMKYILANTTHPIPYAQQDNTTSDSHNYIIQEIRNRLKNKNSEIQFNNSIRELKHARVKADYSSVCFTIEEGLQYKHKADSIIASLKKNFGNI